MPKRRHKRKAPTPARLPGRREPNGRLSRRTIDRAERREMTEREAKSVMIEARMRHTGLPRELVDLTDAGRPNAGTAHGILRLQGALTADQWSAAEWWLGTRQAYLRAILARGEANQHDGPAHGMEDSAAYATWCREKRALWAQVTACLQQASVEQRSPILSAFDVVLVRGQQMDHMTGDLRVGLNAIHRAFLAGARKGVDKSRRACTDVTFS